MDRLLFLLCLLAALTGTPLRQAEAANDLARSLAELDDGDLIEEVDGGVGDDSGVTVQEAANDRALVDASILRATDWLIAPPALDQPLPGVIAGRQGDRAIQLLARSSRRHAWLQCFLF
jgi:hypothetical protein